MTIIITKAIIATTKHGNKAEMFKAVALTISTPGTLSDPSMTPIRNAIVTSS